MMDKVLSETIRAVITAADALTDAITELDEIVPNEETSWENVTRATRAVISYLNHDLPGVEMSVERLRHILIEDDRPYDYNTQMPDGLSELSRQTRFCGHIKRSGMDTRDND